MRHSYPSTNFRYKLSTQFSYAHSTNFRYGIPATLGFGPSTTFHHDLSIKLRKSEFTECGHGSLATGRKLCVSGLHGRRMQLRRMSGLAVYQ